MFLQTEKQTVSCQAAKGRSCSRLESDSGGGSRRQGSNEDRWRPGQEASFGAPMFEPEVLYGIEESTCDIFGTFGAPRSRSAPKKRAPPHYNPVHHILQYVKAGRRQ